MATVGLSFGNLATGSGFDVSSTVDSILAIESGIETPWKTQLTALQSQDTVLSTLGTDLGTLSTALSSLTDFDGVTSSKLGSSSNTNILTLSSAGTTAVAGSHTVTVTSLASTSSDYSTEITNASDVLSGSLTIKVGSTSQKITIGSTTNTLQTLATAINSGSYGVTASVVQDTNGYRLSLVSQTSGSAGQITLTPAITDTTALKPITFTAGQAGADAVLNVDGLPVTSASNTVTTAIPGVTFQLLSAAVGSPVQIQITNDNSSVETSFQSLVTAYNTVVNDLKTQEGKDSSGNAEPLFGSPTIALIQQQLASAIFGGAASGSISSATQLGLTLGQDGTLSLNQTTLDTALNSHFSDIVGFLQNSGSFGQTLTTTLNSLGNVSTKGAVYLAQQENTSKETSLNTSISNQDTRLAAEKIRLTTELNAANQILQSIPQQLSEVDEIYSAVTGYNTGNG